MTKKTTTNFTTATVFTTSIIAVSAFFIWDSDSSVEPRLSPQSTSISVSSTDTTSQKEHELKHNKQTNTLITTPTDSTMLDNNALSLDSLKKMLFPEGDPAWAWAKVDIDRLQKDMPDNLYWELAAPTTDEWLLEHRKEVKAHWDQEYGQILSNNASEKQIRDYYAHQHQVSTDYVLFATQLLNRHIEDLPERDVGFQKLARNLHMARLEELPKKLSNAMERRIKHEQRRAEWLADKEAFAEALRIEKEDAERLLHQG